MSGPGDLIEKVVNEAELAPLVGEYYDLRCSGVSREEALGRIMPRIGYYLQGEFLDATKTADILLLLKERLVQ